MDISYVKTLDFDKKINSGLMRENFGEIHIAGKQLEPIIAALRYHFRTNLNVEKQRLADLDFLIWYTDDQENANLFQITLSDSYSFKQNQTIIERILEIMKNYPGAVQSVRIFKICEIDRSRVEELLIALNNGDVFENISENVSKLCLIDSETYLSDTHITQMIDKLERILFEEIVNRKIRVNGKEGILKEVNGNYFRYGFFERGVRKNYVGLSLVQKMGARTIRELNVLQ
jgi:hypothetical protein